MTSVAARAAGEVIDLAVVASGLHLEELPQTVMSDIDYSLDCAQEKGYVTFDERAFIDLFDGDTLEWFTALHDQPEPVFFKAVKERYAAWRHVAEPANAMALDWAGMRGLRWLFDGCARGVASQIALQIESRSDRDVAGRALRLLSTSSNASFFAARATPVIRRALTDIRRYGPEAFMTERQGVERLYVLEQGRLNIRRQKIQETLTAQVTAAIERGRIAIDQLRAEGVIRKKPPDRATRRVLRNSFSVLEAIAGREKAKAWLSGDEVRVEGKRFDFRIRVANLRHDSSGALDLFVTDKDCVELAKLCVYYPETPALDQVAAMVLHVIAGEEDEIIRTGNVIRATEAAARNEAFSALRASIQRPAVQRINLSDYAMSAEERAANAVLPVVRAAFAHHVEETLWRPLVDLLGETASWRSGFSARERDVTSLWVHNRGAEKAAAA